MLGHVYQGFGQYVKAMESYQKAWETNSEQEVEALFAYAQCCELLMRNDEAKEYYLKVLERDETHAHAHVKQCQKKKTKNKQENPTHFRLSLVCVCVCAYVSMCLCSFLLSFL